MVKFNKKAAVGTILFIVVIIAGITIFLVQNSNKEVQEVNNVRDSAKKVDESGPATISNTPTAPTPTEVQFCKNLNESVETIAIGAKPKNALGRTTKTKNSTLTDCSYSKDDKIVSIRSYEYANETEAKADISNLQIKGYSTKNKGKYTVSVLVVTGAGPNVDSANKILNIALEKL